MPTAARAVVIGFCLLVLAAAAFGVSRVAASAMTVNNVTGARQVTSGLLTVTNTVAGNFTGNGNLDAWSTTFNNGSGASTTGAPVWDTYTGGSASTDWTRTNGSGGYVTRNAGGTTPSVALFPWLTRQSTITITVKNLPTTNTMGIVIGANSTGTNALVVYRAGTASTSNFGFKIVSGGSESNCGTPISTSTGITAFTLAVTYEPATGSAASATLTRTTGGSGGPWTTNSSCTLSGANGQFAGLYSGTASTGRYVTMSAAL